jgi:hypothetical protein
VAFTVVVAGCGGGGEHKPTPPKRRIPPFQPRPVKVRVVPRVGNPLTTFRIHVDSRAAVSARAHVIRTYEARFMRRPLLSNCITDTGPVFPRADRRPVLIVLNPRHQKGGRWCRGHFSSPLTYYRDYLCPNEGVCRPPKNFPRRQKRVARVAFEVR